MEKSELASDKSLLFIFCFRLGHVIGARNIHYVNCSISGQNEKSLAVRREPYRSLNYEFNFSLVRFSGVALLDAGTHLCDSFNMERKYHKSYSRELQHDMELLVYGHEGMPVIVFPTSKGRFFDYEDRGMISTLSPRIDNGMLQVFCADSVDAESWYNKGADPRHRVLRHMQYERYLLHELLPLIRSNNSSSQLAVTGCSFGGYHTMNFSLRHPDLVNYCVSMGGAFDIHQFLNGYYDDDCYFNCPPDFMSSMSDDWYLSRYRNMKIVLASAEHDICRDENVRLSEILNSKGIPHTLDIWGDNAGHDWPWWQQMAVKFFL